MGFSGKAPVTALENRGRTRTAGLELKRRARRLEKKWCISSMWFLARWAKKLSWTEVANTFNTSWSTVFRAVEIAVMWGRAHVNLENIKSIRIDEISWKMGYKDFLTLVYQYQIDEGVRRLLWVGEHRRANRICASAHPPPAPSVHGLISPIASAVPGGFRSTGKLRACAPRRS